MSEFLRNLGKRVAPAMIKTRWIYRSLTGTESERIQAEYSMGCYLTYLHTRDGNLDRDAKTIEWLKQLTARLTLTVVNRERKFQVRCLADADANAFALPGGFLFISRALLDLCEFDQDEIAFVLAHEMAHVLRSHSFNRLLTTEVIQLIARGGPISGVLKPILSQMIRRLVAQGYSRQQEFEADRVATRITRVAGYDPTAAIRLFERLEKQAPDPGAIGPYFSSHPTFPVRIDRIRKALAADR